MQTVTPGHVMAFTAQTVKPGQSFMSQTVTPGQSFMSPTVTPAGHHLQQQALTANPDTCGGTTYANDKHSTKAR